MLLYINKYLLLMEIEITLVKPADYSFKNN